MRRPADGSRSQEKSVKPSREGVLVQKTPYQCVVVKGWNILSQLVPGRVMSPALTPALLMKSAKKAAGFSDYASTTFHAPLERFLKSVENTGDLHPFGRFYLKKVIIGLLVNRLKLVDLWNHHPEILDETIRLPIIILGLPRTGTSFLFTLLAQDPAHRYLSNWEATVSQAPPEGSYTWENDPRRKLGKHLMRFQRYLAPHMGNLHTFCLDGPEECTTLLMQEFTTQAFAGMFNVLSYSEWLGTASHAATYYHHKRILQTLQWKYPGERWLLKSPAHIEAIDALLEVYPDVRMIQMHRDPVKAVSSYASLCAAFRGISTRSIDFRDLGSQAMNRLAVDFERYLTQRTEYDSSRFLDLHYIDLVRDPLGTVRHIYNRFELVLSAEAEKRMQAFLAKERESKSSHRYSPEDFGLTAQRIRQRFQAYIDAFDIPEES